MEHVRWAAAFVIEKLLLYNIYDSDLITNDYLESCSQDDSRVVNYDVT